GSVVEIANGYGRANLVFAAEKAADIPAVFAEQALSLVFGMSLKVDEEALLLLLDETVNAGVDRLRKDRVTALRKLFLLHLVPARVRYGERARQPIDQGMVRRFRLGEDSEAFGTQGMALDAVGVQ